MLLPSKHFCSESTSKTKHLRLHFVICWSMYTCRLCCIFKNSNQVKNSATFKNASQHLFVASIQLFLNRRSRTNRRSPANRKSSQNVMGWGSLKVMNTIYIRIFVQSKSFYNVLKKTKTLLIVYTSFMACFSPWNAFKNNSWFKFN